MNKLIKEWIKYVVLSLRLPAESLSFKIGKAASTQLRRISNKVGANEWVPSNQCVLHWKVLWQVTAGFFQIWCSCQYCRARHSILMHSKETEGLLYWLWEPKHFCSLKTHPSTVLQLQSNSSSREITKCWYQIFLISWPSVFSPRLIPSFSQHIWKGKLPFYHFPPTAEICYLFAEISSQEFRFQGFWHKVLCSE